jgi:U32 family peptidase
LTHSIPELLAPAGDLDKLKVSILYGASAVYLGGHLYNLRQASTNFTYPELKEAVLFAHEHNAKVFIVVNNFFHDEDFEEFKSYLEFLQSIKVDALIASDLGVINFIKTYTDLEVHLSTQASCLNVESAKFWKAQGVSRIVLGRELSIAEAKIIKKEAQIEVEMFVHGSMCMAYSGHCTISNFTSGRDSNRGGCAHSCRFEYSLDLGERKQSAFFMSSKDLNGLNYLEKFIEAGIDSLKIEGRMKSYNYAGGVTKAYAEALRFYQNNGSLKDAPFALWAEELAKVTHRDYTEASLIHPADKDSIYFDREHEINDYKLVGNILAVKEGQYLLMETKGKFEQGQELEIVPFVGGARKFKVEEMYRLNGERVSVTRPSTVIKIPFMESVSAYNIVRMRTHL